MAFIGLDVLVGFDTLETVVTIVIVVVMWVGLAFRGCMWTAKVAGITSKRCDY